MKTVAGIAAGVATLVVLVVLGVFFFLVAAVGGAAGFPPTPAATAAVPPALLAVEMAAAAACPGLPWQILAAIGTVEDPSVAGQLDPATGRLTPPQVGPPLDGTGGTTATADPSSPDGWAHDLGLFHQPSTVWTHNATVGPGRPAGAVPDPQNAWDDTATLVHTLCAGRTRLTDPAGAVSAYNPDPAVDEQIWQVALTYGMTNPAAAARGHAGRAGTASSTSRPSR